MTMTVHSEHQLTSHHKVLLITQQLSYIYTKAHTVGMLHSHGIQEAFFVLVVYR